MKLFKRLVFAWKYDFSQEFIVFDFKDQQAVRFLSYKDAREFSQKQIEYLPKVLMEVRAVKT